MAPKLNKKRALFVLTRIDEILGWAGRQPTLREWLVARGMWEAGDPKPGDPKTGVEQALREVRIHRSSALYRRLAEKVGLASCKDDAFARLRAILSGWFPV